MEAPQRNTKTHPAWVTYPVALLSVAAAVLLRWLIHPLMGDQLQLITLYGGVAIAVWFGGWLPAALAAIAGFAAADYLFMFPRFGFVYNTPAFWSGVAAYSLSCGIIIYLGHAMRQAQRRAETHSRELEQAARRQEVIYRFVERRHRAASLAEIHESGLDAILEALQCQSAAILLIDESGVMRFVGWRDLSDEYRKAVEGHSPWKIDEPDPQAIWIEDIKSADFDESLKKVVLNEGIRSLGFIPLVAEGSLIGKFMVYCDAPRRFTDDEIDLGLNIGRQLVLGIERKHAEEKLEQSEERLRLATQAGKVGVWEWDILANHVTWTDSIYDIHRISREQFNPTVEGFTALVHPDDRQLVSKAIDRTLNENAPYELSFRTLNIQGEVTWIFTNAVVVRKDGKPVRMIGATTDITELKRTEEALEQAKRQAEAANLAKDQFLATLSHELRTPLTPVLMTASALESDRTIATDLREQLAMVRRNIELEARIIDDLLDLSRIIYGKFELRRQDVDVHGAIEHALKISARDLRTKNLRVRKRFAAAEHFSSADETRLQQVFWNILRNAVKFTPEGGKIDIVTRNDDDHGVVIEFTDTGIGIEPELQPRIFEAFEQGARRQGPTYGGLGLGLAISKRIVNLHEGTIEAESAGPGRGSTFRIKLNTVPAPPGASEAADASAQTLAPARILIVEDHTDTSNVLRRVLENAGYEASICDGVQSARAAANGEKFDVLISDIALPDGSGLELMRDLRDAQGLTGIALSGFGTLEDLAASSAAGFAVHLTKPVDIQRLLATLSELLSRRFEAPTVEQSQPSA